MTILLKKKNFAKSTLASGIDSDDTSITLATGTGTLFPASGVFRAVLWGSGFASPDLDSSREIVQAQISSGDVFTITRAQESTTAGTWSAGTNFTLVLTAGTVDEIETEIATKTTGPASAVGDNFASYDGTTGKIVKDSGYNASSFAPAGHNHNGVYAPVLGADDNYVTDAEKTKLANLSGTNTGDQTLPVKASGAELDTGTDDAKFATAKALKDSHNVPSVAPGASGNVLTSNGTDWTSATPSGGGAMTYKTGGTGSSVNNITISSLDLDTDKHYMVVCRYFAGSLGGGNTWKMYVNGDNASGHYGYSYSGYNNSGTKQGSGVDQNMIEIGGNYFRGFFIVHIRKVEATSEGDVHFQFSSNLSGDQSTATDLKTEHRDGTGIWSVSASGNNVTSITFDIDGTTNTADWDVRVYKLAQS